MRVGSGLGLRATEEGLEVVLDVVKLEELGGRLLGFL